MNQQSDLDALVDKIANSRKYRTSGIPRQTIADILQQELQRHPKAADAAASARAILHNVLAPYLGDPDYEAERLRLDRIIAGNDKEALLAFCLEILAQHDSTRERLPYLQGFYAAIREIVPRARVVLDLACGLNPFALPMMGLPQDVEYHAYDIHQARVDLINHFFASLALQPLAEVRDVLLDAPQIKADADFLFKEAHRMEKRRKGCSLELVRAINARVIFISLPNRSLGGQRDLRRRMDALFQQMSSGMSGESGSREFPGETLYWIRKSDG